MTWYLVLYDLVSHLWHSLVRLCVLASRFYDIIISRFTRKYLVCRADSEWVYGSWLKLMICFYGNCYNPLLICNTHPCSFRWFWIERMMSVLYTTCLINVFLTVVVTVVLLSAMKHGLTVVYGTFNFGFFAWTIETLMYCHIP